MQRRIQSILHPGCHIHSRQSAHRLASELIDRLGLNAHLFSDSYYETVDTIQRYGIITAYHCCQIMLNSEPD
jgi:hypothetical protein